jgi:hypothetical protein
MTDVASLSFNIDTSNVPPAVQNLDQLADATDKVSARTRFLISSSGDANTALTQLATSGRASLASFEQISKDLDQVTGRLNAMRAAVADTVGTLQNNGLSAALSGMQQQFDAMSQLFGSSAAQLEKFNQQAQYLGMNAYQVTSALQRITEAQQNMTPAGQGLRQGLLREGISTAGDPSDILRQIVAYTASHQQSQQAFQTFQGFVGPTDPATYARLMNQPYHTIQQQNQMSNLATLGYEASRVAQSTATTQYQNQFNREKYDDMNANFSFGSRSINPFRTDRKDLIDDMEKTAARDRASGKTGEYTNDMRNLDVFRQADLGSVNYVNSAGSFLNEHPGDFKQNMLNRTFTGLMNYASQPDGGGIPSWYARFKDRQLQDNNQNRIHANYETKEDNIGSWDIGGHVRDEDSRSLDTIKNRLGLYHDRDPYQQSLYDKQRDLELRQQVAAQTTAAGRGSWLSGYVPKDNQAAIAADQKSINDLMAGGDPTNKKDVGANEQYFMDQNSAGIAAQVGNSGYQEQLSAGNNIINLLDKGPKSYIDQLTQRVGSKEAMQVRNQELATQSYISAQAATPGFDQLQQLKAQGFVDDQAAGAGRGAALVQFMRDQHADPGRLIDGGPGGRAQTVDEAINGTPGASAGAVLTDDQRTGFGKIWNQFLANDKSGADSQFKQSQNLTTGLDGLVQSGEQGGQYAAMAAGMRAFSQEMGNSGDVATANVLKMHAYVEAITAQGLAADQATLALKTQNKYAALSNAAGISGLADGPGGAAAAMSEQEVQNKVAQFKTDYPTKDATAYAQSLRAGRGISYVSSAIANTVGAQNETYGALSSLGAFGLGSDAQNRALVTSQAADELQGTKDDPAAHQAVLDQINATVSLKDKLSETNQALTGLNELLGGDRRATEYDKAAAMPASQRTNYLAQLQLGDQILSQTDPTAGIGAGYQTGEQSAIAQLQRAAGSPAASSSAAQPYVDRAALAGLPMLPSGTPNNNPTNLRFYNQAGATGVTPNGVTVFGSAAAGVAGAENQMGMDITTHHYDTLTKLMNSWSPEKDGNNTPKMIAGMAAQLTIDPNAKLASDPASLARLFQAEQAQETGGVSGVARLSAADGVRGLSHQQSSEERYQSGITYSNIGSANQASLASRAYLLQGRTGAAELARAGIVPATTSAGLAPSMIAQQTDQVNNQLADQYASLQGSQGRSIGSNQMLTAAYAAGGTAVPQAQATLLATDQANQMYAGPESGRPAWIAAQAGKNMAVTTSSQNLSAQTQVTNDGISNALKIAQLNDQFITNPVARSVADAIAQAQAQATKEGLAPGSAAAQQLMQQAVTNGTLSGKAQQMGQAQQTGDQIGGDVSSTLQNLMFTYQHGPGAGNFARQQFSGLFNQGARSLFNQAIGAPISKDVSTFFSKGIDNLMGNGNNGNTSSTAPTGQGSGSSTPSPTAGLLNSIGSGIGSFGGTALKGLESLFGSGAAAAAGPSTSALIAHTGASAIDPALSGGGSALSSFGSWISSFFATGGAFSGGQRMPYALGGSFGPGQRVPFASGDVFNSPTTMPMALMGEAGPEAIMPLRRGADGSLGVAAPVGGGGGGGGGITVNAPISIGAGALNNSGKMSAQQQKDLQKQLHETVTSAVKGVVAQQTRPGGMLRSQSG